MMHRLRRYDAFASQIWCCSTTFRNDAMFAQCAVRHTWFAKRTSLGVAQHHLPQANIIQKSLICPVDKLGFFVGGGWWIRTTEVSDNRFTVCPLWPLGKSPILWPVNLFTGILPFPLSLRLELVIGVEPTTCWLQISCSAIEPHQRNENIIPQQLSFVKRFLKVF